MSEESILILNMLREGKITAEQADSLLHAVRQTPVPPPPPAQAVPPLPPPPAQSVDVATLAAMQNKLGDLQHKLGELQSNLGAAQTARAAGQAVSFAGKILDHMPKPDMDFSRINRTVDEAMRGLNSFKNDAVRSAKVAGRQAAQEARRMARQGRKSMKFDMNMSFGCDKETGRPANAVGLPEAAETSESSVNLDQAVSLSLQNLYGNVKIIGEEETDGNSIIAKVTKTAWAESESDARVLLQQIFLTNRIENGQCRVEIVAPSDAKDRVAVDYEIHIPQELPLNVETTFGDIDAEAVSAILTTETISGETALRRPSAEQAGEAKLTSRSGGMQIHGWNAPEGKLTVDTLSGDIAADGLSCRQAIISSRSGEVKINKLQAVADTTFESVSGDVMVDGGSVGTRATAKTQSGDVAVRNLRADQLSVETISGDADLDSVAGTLTVKTVSGEIAGLGIHSTAVSLSTVSGDARWAFAAPFSGSLAGTTVSGELTVVLWTNSDTRIEINTTNGELRCDLPLADKSPDNAKQIVGKVGEGTGSLKLQSVSGDLRIEEEK